MKSPSRSRTKNGAPRCRNLATGWISSLATLEAVTDEAVKLPITPLLVRIDLNDDGSMDESETLIALYAKLAGEFDPANAANLRELGKKYQITIDIADVYWLRSYICLLRAQVEGILAYDMAEFFDACGPVLFSGARSSHAVYDAASVKSSRARSMG